jgi:hypothetical protein
MSDCEQSARGPDPRRGGPKGTERSGRSFSPGGRATRQKRSLTGPAHPREWAPLDGSGRAGNFGTVRLTTVRASTTHVLRDCLGGRSGRAGAFIGLDDAPPSRAKSGTLAPLPGTASQTRVRSQRRRAASLPTEVGTTSGTRCVGVLFREF